LELEVAKDVLEYQDEFDKAYQVEGLIDELEMVLRLWLPVEFKTTFPRLWQRKPPILKVK
jgi:hypothetical protein